MKPRYGTVAGLFACIVLFAALAGAADMPGQNDPNMGASSISQTNQQALTSDPQNVMKIQQALSDKGYFEGTADGKWNSQTQNALKNYQQSQGLQANGQLDQQTLASLGLQVGSAGGGQQDMSSRGAGGLSSGQSSTGTGAGGMSSGQSSTGYGAGGTMDNPQSTTNGGQTRSNY